jgi:hypothetical protein
MTEETKTPEGGKFVTLMLGFILGYQGVKIVIHAGYWVLIAGLIAAHFWLK